MIQRQGSPTPAYPSATKDAAENTKKVTTRTNPRGLNLWSSFSSVNSRTPSTTSASQRPHERFRWPGEALPAPAPPQPSPGLLLATSGAPPQAPARPLPSGGSPPQARSEWPTLTPPLRSAFRRARPTGPSALASLPPESKNPRG